MSGAGDSDEIDDPEGEFDLLRHDEEPEPRLRRGLFGYRAGDVRDELARRRAEAAELRHDIAALWLAFGQQERAIRELIDEVEELGGGRVVDPGEEPAPQAGPESAPPGEPSRPEDDPIGTELSDLGEVLAAIEQATRSLERAYADQIEPPPAADEREAGTGGSSQDDPEAGNGAEAPGR